ncbi:hypothetical protein HA052_25165, partial [Chromobacterium haemolyticum]|nr:hypothetical protein [Chromobacterium haemolyticum]
PNTSPSGDQLIKVKDLQFELNSYPVRLVDKPAPGSYSGNATLKFKFD